MHTVAADGALPQSLGEDVVSVCATYPKGVLRPPM